MENLYYNLSEEEFSKGRKILLWIFAGLFFLAGVYILIISLVFVHKSIPAVLSVAPFGISIVVSAIAAFATVKRKDLFFSVDNDKIEFRYGIINPKKHSFKWIDIKELIMPHEQRKAMLLLKDGSSFVIDLTWLQKKKSSHIRKHIYHAAREKNLNVVKVINLGRKGILSGSGISSPVV
jgi:membrane protein YdbS with pleckstrin-like domain